MYKFGIHEEYDIEMCAIFLARVKSCLTIEEATCRMFVWLRFGYPVETINSDIKTN